MSTSLSQFPDFGLIAEPQLAFHADRLQDRDVHPLRGLVRFGPYSKSLLKTVLDPIRVAAIVPHGRLPAIEGLIREFEHAYKPRERPQYLVDFPGFSRVFGVRCAFARDVCVELPSSFDNELRGSDKPQVALANRLTQALNTLQDRRTDFDVVVVLLPEGWATGFYGGDDEDFDLHDYLKATCATRDMPLQVIREAGALSYSCRASVMWRLGIALYTKAGGVPWKIADQESEIAFVGLSYAMRSQDDRDGRFVTCCSQVFDADGAGLEFIAYETSDAHVEKKNPFLSRTEMRRVMSRSLALYQRRHAGRRPHRLVVHKSTEFKDEEVDGCFDAWSASEGLELLQVQQDTSWRGIHLEPSRDGQNRKGVAARYPCHRGTFIQLSGRDVLLWTQGDAPAVAKQGSFFKEGRGIPSPIVVVRFAGHGGFEESCRWILGLTKMDWNNDALYNQLPVTMSYATVLAQTLRRMPFISPRAYPFRLFM